MYVVLRALFIYFYLFSKVLLVVPHPHTHTHTHTWLTHVSCLPIADAVTRKAVETGTRLHQTLWSLTGKAAREQLLLLLLCLWTSRWMSERVNDSEERVHVGWAGEQVLPLPVCQTAQLGLPCVLRGPQCGNRGVSLCERLRGVFPRYLCTEGRSPPG